DQESQKEGRIGRAIDAAISPVVKIAGDLQSDVKLAKLTAFATLILLAGAVALGLSLSKRQQSPEPDQSVMETLTALENRIRVADEKARSALSQTAEAKTQIQKLQDRIESLTALAARAAATSSQSARLDPPPQRRIESPTPSRQTPVI